MNMEVAKRLFDYESYHKMSAAGILRQNEHLELYDGKIILVHANGNQRYFTVDEYYKLAEVGLLDEDDRVELLDGEIVQMSPIGSRHAAAVTKFSSLLLTSVGESAIVSVQNPIRLSEKHEPLPDIAILKRREDFYRNSHPTPTDTFLLVEVADSSVGYDRGRKIPVYAKAGIHEVWLYNLNTNTITQYARPQEGKYQAVLSFGRGETIRSISLPTLMIAIDAILL